MKLIDYMIAKPRRIYITYLAMLVIAVVLLYYAHDGYPNQHSQIINK